MAKMAKKLTEKWPFSDPRFRPINIIFLFFVLAQHVADMLARLGKDLKWLETVCIHHKLDTYDFQPNSTYGT